MKLYFLMFDSQIISHDVGQIRTSDVFVTIINNSSLEYLIRNIIDDTFYFSGFMVSKGLMNVLLNIYNILETFKKRKKFFFQIYKKYVLL